MAQIADQEYEKAVPVSSLQLHPRNARQGNVGLIHQSIEFDKFYGACIVQKSTRHILAGNHRYLAAREAGLDHLPVIWVNCDDDQAARIMLVDNKSSDEASYDIKALAAQLSELQQLTEDGLNGTGFSDEDLEDLIKQTMPASIETDDGGGGDEDDEGPKQHAVLVLCDNLMDQDEICGRLSQAGQICRKVVVTEETLTALSKTSPKTPRKRQKSDPRKPDPQRPDSKKSARPGD